MDVLTAGVALVLVQLCIAVFMAGTFYATPNEKCTRFWAQSGVLTGLGLLMVVINAGAPNYALLIISNNTLIGGLILQWLGLRAFYKRRPGAWGWGIAVIFFLAYGLLLIINAKIADRVVLSAITTMVVFILNFHELRKSRTSRLTFASVLAMFALTALIASSALRVIANLWRNPAFLPTTTSSVGIAVVYLVPLVGSLLFSVALLLLYFERMVQDKQHLATHDELTGLLNRRAIISGAEREIDVAKRLRQSLSVAYIDVDFFKKINDELGHEKGDTVLVDLSQVLKKNCRDIDLVGRYGGEEYCIIFPGVDYGGAEIIGEKLVNVVRQHCFQDKLCVTISVGISVLPAENQLRGWTALIREADAALYRAKELGRNRFCISCAPSLDSVKIPQAK